MGSHNGHVKRLSRQELLSRFHEHRCSGGSYWRLSMSSLMASRQDRPGATTQAPEARLRAPSYPQLADIVFRATAELKATIYLRKKDYAVSIRRHEPALVLQLQLAKRVSFAHSAMKEMNDVATPFRSAVHLPGILKRRSRLGSCNRLSKSAANSIRDWFVGDWKPCPRAAHKLRLRLPPTWDTLRPSGLGQLWACYLC
jgi:hypothetical protein